MNRRSRAQGQDRADAKPNMSGPNGSPCTTCAKRDTCEEICDRLEKLLPPKDAGAQFPTVDPRIADQFGQYPQGLGNGKKEIFEIFFDHRSDLTQTQWRCVELYYGEDLSAREAAEALGISHQVVVEHLALARRKIIKKYLPDFLKGGEV